MEPQLSSNKEEVDIETAVETSAEQSTASTPCKTVRERGDGCLNTEGTCSPEANGAATSVAASGRVLRDRSMRALPSWRQSDLGEDRAEGTRDAAANRRRKAIYPRRRRSAAASAGPSDTDYGQPDECEESKDGLVIRASRGRRAQVRSGARTCRGPPRTVFKVEPETDSDYAEANKSPENTGTSVEKKEDESIDDDDDDDLIEEEEASYTDDPKDRNYFPHTQSSGEEVISSEEDVPFRDDVNDQSYDPKDLPKLRRKPITRHERKDKTVMIETEDEEEHDTEIKTEGGESTDERIGVELAGEVAELPRKRGRRRKDDKTPRLPKRRKKPPVQYVRCEMEGCGTVLAHPRYLQHHIKYQHLMKKKYVCPHPSCGRLFRLQKQLLRHAKHHTDQRDYICEFCARAFKSSHNLAVHRMIHTGEKPLQCEICGFTCRQKASLNWHMKKHDADATYQFSCSICGKKFEKKDSVVAHKAKSHPEVLIAEALAANAGSLITTPVGVTTLLESSTGPAQTEQAVSEAQGSSVVQAGQVGPTTHMGPVMVMDQDNNLHAMQVPVTLALPPTEEENSAASQQASSQALQMPLQFVAAPVSQQQHQIHQLKPTTTVTQHSTLVQQLPAQSYNPQPQIVHMTFRALPQQQLPMLSIAQQLPFQTTQPQQTQVLTRPSNPPIFTTHHSQTLSATSSDCRSNLGYAANPPPASPQSSTGPSETRQIIWAGDGVNSNGNGAEGWEAGGEGEEQNMADRSDGQIQRVLI